MTIQKHKTTCFPALFVKIFLFVSNMLHLPPDEIFHQPKTSDNMLNDQQIMESISHDNHVAFSMLFERWYKELVVYANIFIHDTDKCEDIVQSVFARLWENRHELKINTSVAAYLHGSVKNQCLNSLKHEKIRNEYQIYVTAFQDDFEDLNKSLNFKECLEKFNQSVDELPEKYREIFVLSRIHGRKYDEIAAKIGISKRTVEERMRKAILILKSLMKDFLIILMYVIYG